MTDEQCMSIPAMRCVDADGFPCWVTCWLPNMEDIQAIVAGRPIYVKILSNGQLSPHSIFTADETGGLNI